MGPFIAAWLVGEGIIVYRSVKAYKAPPGPGQLLLSSGVFVMLGLLSEAQQARFLATALAWGFDAAAFMNLFGAPPKADDKKAKLWPPATAKNTVIFPTCNKTDDKNKGKSNPAPTDPNPWDGITTGSPKPNPMGPTNPRYINV